MLPPEIVNAMWRNDAPRTGIHMTELTICPYKVNMQKKLDYYLPIETIYRMARGKAWDSLAVENSRADGIYQYTMTKSIHGIPITGTPDILVPEKGVIYDYKAPARMYTQASLGYTMQLNGYRWLTKDEFMWPTGAAYELYLLACGPAGFKKMPVDVWDMEDIVDELETSLHVLDEVQREEPRLCSDSDCIYCRSKAVYVY